MDLQQVRESLGDLAKTVIDFKAAHEREVKELREKGFVTGETKERIENLQNRIDAIETAMNRSSGAGRVGKISDLTYDQKAHKEGFLRYARKGDEIGLHELETKAMSQGVLPDGGYLVSTDIDAEIDRYVREMSPLRQVCRVQQVSGTGISVRRRTGFAGFGGWVSETQVRPATASPTLGHTEIKCHESYAYPEATQQLLEDSSFNVEDFLIDEISETLAYYEGKATIDGDGVGKPRGILTYPDGTSDQQIEQVVSGHATQVTGDGLIDVQTALKEPYQPNGRFLLQRLTLRAIRKLKDSQGQYLWQPGLAAGIPNTILDKPYTLAADMPAVGAGALAVAYGDFRRGYRMAERPGLRVLRDAYSHKPYVGFYTTKRVGGDVVNFEAIKLLRIAA